MSAQAKMLLKQIEPLLQEVCKLSHKHEVQYWRDVNLTDAEKLHRILNLAREALAIARGKIDLD